MRISIKKFTVDSTYLLLSTGVVNILLFALSIIIPRFFGKLFYDTLLVVEGFYFAIFLIFDIGISRTSIRFISENDKIDNAKRVITFVFFIALIVMPLAILLIYLGARPFSSFLGKDFELYFKITALWLFFLYPKRLFLAIFEGFHKIRLVSVLSIILPLGKVVIVLFCLLSKNRGITDLLWGYLGICILDFIISFGWLIKLLVEKQMALNLSCLNKNVVKRFSSFAVYSHIPLIAVFLVPIFLAFFISKYSEQPGQNSYFAIGMSLTSIALFFLTPISRNLFLHISGLYGEKDQLAIKKIGGDIIGIVLLIGAITLPIYILLGKVAINLIYGKAFGEAYSVMILLSFANGFGFARILADPILLGSGHEKIVTRIEIFKLVLLFLLAQQFIPNHKAFGAAITFSVATYVGMGLKLYYLKKHFKTNFKKPLIGFFVVQILLMLYLLPIPFIGHNKLVPVIAFIILAIWLCRIIKHYVTSIKEI